MKHYCSNHPEIVKKADCFVCGKSICEECISFIADKAYCKSCGYGVISEAEILYLKKIYKTIREHSKNDIIDDKRKYQRVRIVKPVEIYDEQKNEEIKAVMIDISIGDMSIISDKSLSLKDRLKLNFILGESFHFKQVDGGVVRVNKVGEKYHIAILFMNLGENREKLEDFITGKIRKKFVREGIGYV